MHIILNGEPRDIADGTDLASLIAGLGIKTRYAVEVNQDLVPRAHHPGWQLKDGDRVELVNAIGGG